MIEHQETQHDKGRKTKPKCLIAKCQNEGSLKNLCRKHYHNYYMVHRFDKSIPDFVTYVDNRVEYQKNPERCIVHACTDRACAKALCNKHYTSWKTTYRALDLHKFLEIKKKEASSEDALEKMIN